MSFFDNWLAFNECFDSRNLSALTQLVGYKLLAVDNELQHPESFLLSDRTLMTRAGIRSGQSIVQARRELKNVGLIDFKAGKGAKPTRYWFTIKRESSENDDSTKQDSSKIQASRVISYTQREEEEKRNEDDDAGAREAENVAVATGKDADAGAHAKPLTSPKYDPNDIQDIWAKELGYELRGNRALELEQLAGEDFERAKSAILKTAKKKGLHDEFTYFKAVYNTLKPSKLMKGSDEVYGDPSGYVYDPPAELPPDIAEQIRRFKERNSEEDS